MCICVCVCAHACVWLSVFVLPLSSALHFCCTTVCLSLHGYLSGTPDCKTGMVILSSRITEGTHRSILQILHSLYKLLRTCLGQYQQKTNLQSMTILLAHLLFFLLITMEEEIELNKSIYLYSLNIKWLNVTGKVLFISTEHFSLFQLVLVLWPTTFWFASLLSSTHF